MKPTARINVIRDADTHELVWIDASYDHMIREAGVTGLDKAEALAKVRAGLAVPFEVDGHKFELIGWNLSTGTAFADYAKQEKAKQKKAS